MAKITITVPNGEKCTRCPYITRSYVETHYGGGHDEYWCKIFKQEIYNSQKCDKCYLETCVGGGE